MIAILFLLVLVGLTIVLSLMGAGPGQVLIWESLLLVVLCVGWGSSWITMRIALSEIAPFTMRASGHVIGAGTLIALAWLQGRSLTVASAAAWGHICMGALFNVVAFSVFTAFAQLTTDTSRVAILIYTMPVWATLLALPILGERLTRTRTLALTLFAAGIAILIAPLAAVGFPAGTLLAIGASMSWAAGTVFRMTRDMRPVRWQSRMPERSFFRKGGASLRTSTVFAAATLSRTASASFAGSKRRHSFSSIWPMPASTLSRVASIEPPRVADIQRKRQGRAGFQKDMVMCIRLQ